MCEIRLLEANEIQVRVGQVTQTQNGQVYATYLLYKDARCDMAILDETFGAMNWKKEYSRDNKNCTVSIWDIEKSQWVSKEDTGTESNTEAEKGLASDSFKRACVNWGIGRELYTAPNIRIKLEDKDYYKKNDRPVPTINLSVSLIKYDENRNIIELALVDEKMNTRFTYTDKVKTSLQEAKNEQKQEVVEEQRTTIEDLAYEYNQLADKAIALQIDFMFNERTNTWFKKRTGIDDLNTNYWDYPTFVKANTAIKELIKMKEDKKQNESSNY